MKHHIGTGRSLRRASIVMNAFGTISLILSLLIAFFPQGGAKAQGGSGAIWTTLVSCGSPEQDINHFAVGDPIYVNGSGFDPGVAESWSIKGNPGGSSGDPNIVVASGTVTPDTNGAFCFLAYTVLPGDWGEYSVKVGNKGDNYRVDQATPGSISVVKDASPTSVPETGAPVTFTVTVNNTDAAVSFTLTSLIDDVFGNLNGIGTCSVPQTITPLGSYVCSFTTTISGEAGANHVNTVTASGTDAGGFTLTASDNATVGFTDVLPTITVAKTAIPTSVTEPGGSVTFSITVTNTSAEVLTLNSLTDSVFGNLNGQGSCSVPQTLAASGGAYTCSFSTTVSGQPADTHTDTVTASATDNEGNTATDDDPASVTFIDILPDISIVKTANPTVVLETGENVTYSLTVTNNSAEALTLTSLVDNIYGDLNGQGSCAVPQTLTASGGNYTCSFTKLVSSFPGDTITDVITATASDNDGNSDTASDDASVTILDVVPNVRVDKDAAPTIIPETGDEVTYTVTVTNTGPVTIYVLSLVDDVFGNLNGKGTCSLPQTLATLGSYTCTFTETISGTAGSLHINTVTVTAEDAQLNPVSDTDDASVEFSDVLPNITVDKSANPTEVSELGGDVTYTVLVTNIAPIAVSLDSLIDDVFGDLNGQGTCSLPQALAPMGEAGDSYTCAFTAHISGEPGVPHINNVTATATDEDQNTAQDSDDAIVIFSDVLPAISVTKVADPTSLLEPGGVVTYTVMVINLSGEPVTLNSLSDSIAGDLNSKGSCVVPQALAANGEAGDDYTCSFTAPVVGEPGDTHTNIVTAQASDNDGSQATDTDDASVTFIDVLPVIEVIKSADPTIVPETGGTVTYTVTVTNPSAEALTLTSLIDDIYGNLNGQGTCAVPQTLAASGGSYTCSFTKLVSGTAGTTVTDVVTARAGDNDDNFDEATDDASVVIQDVLPSITVEKTAAPGAVPESGGDVTYTVTVTNSGDVDLVLDSLVDDIFGDLNGLGTCSVPQNLAPLAQYICNFTKTMSGEATTPHTNTVTAGGYDGDQNRVTDADPATVEFIDVLPSIIVDKSPSVGSVLVPGANVTFTVKVTNLASEAVQITGLVDSLFGDLNGKGTCAAPQTLQPNGKAGDSYTCSFTAFVGGAAGATHVNVVTASGSDNEDPANAVSDEDDAVVRILSGGNPPPLIPVTGIDLGSGFPLSPFGFASIGMVFFGLGIVTRGYANKREQEA